jgi:hypothetical protein
VECRMGKNYDHKECSLEDNGINEPQLLVEREGLAAESQLLSFAWGLQPELPAVLDPL